MNYAHIENGYIMGLCEADYPLPWMTEITENVAIVVRSKMKDIPHAPEGYAYILRADNLEWELVEMPPAPDEPITEDAALTRYAIELTGSTAETLQEATENLIKQLKENK